MRDRRILKWLAVAAAGTALLTACGAAVAQTPTAPPNDAGGMQAPTAETTEAATGAPDASGLAGTSWTLTQIDGAAVDASVGATLTFSADGKATGVGGCNGFGGSYSTSGTNVTFSELVSTEMACIGPKMDVETQYLGALQGTDSFSLSGDALVISGANGVKLTFAKSQ